jgi:hypothetical protein
LGHGAGYICSAQGAKGAKRGLTLWAVRAQGCDDSPKRGKMARVGNGWSGGRAKGQRRTHQRAIAETRAAMGLAVVVGVIGAGQQVGHDLGPCVIRLVQQHTRSGA